jgi:hypothetical protein
MKLEKISITREPDLSSIYSRGLGIMKEGWHLMSVEHSSQVVLGKVWQWATQTPNVMHFISSRQDRLLLAVADIDTEVLMRMRWEGFEGTAI